ncbi:MAG: hypothetical protein ACYDHP_06560 [Ferrimicrobium sp.]
MASKMEIELTSKVGDDHWTWRAAGAKNPRGTLPVTLIYSGAKVGDIARAEVSIGIDGIEILSLHAPQTPTPPQNRIEVVGRQRDEPSVTYPTQASQRRPRPERGERGERGEARGNPREARQRREGSGKPDSRARADRSEGRNTPTRTRTNRNAPSRPEPKRLHPKETNRNAVLDQLLPEHRPIGEQLLRGGLPAVRTALAIQNEQARAAGLPETPPEAFLKIAEGILPKMRVATWLDRAEAALEMAQDIPLKDLRSVAASADRSAKDPRATELMETLQKVLEERSSREIAAWQEEINVALNENRLVRALRLSFRLPDPAAKLDPELAKRLVDLSSAEMQPETPTERWLILIDAVAGSPIRRSVVPVGLPVNPSPELVEFAKENAGRIPALAQLLGITVPPPPKPELVARVNRNAHRRPKPEVQHGPRG